MEERVGRNKRPYTAYSGVIFKIAVGDAALHTAYLSLVYLMLAPEDVNSGSAPFLAAPQRRNAVFRLLRDHCKQIGAPDPCCKQDWFARIPHGAFAVALDWVIGRRPYLPGAAPDATIRAAFIARVMRPERLRLAVQRAAWLSRRALMVRPLSAQAPTVLVPAPKAVVPTTGFKPVPFRPFEEISSETREGSWSAWWLLAAVALLLLLIPMRTVEQENEVISAPDEQALRIMPLYTRLNIEGEAPRKTSGIEQEKIPDIASPDQLERYFIPEP
ncbi:hypothetical protein [Acanthopleuribacter pedis]|uniref:Transmembrane protein n=1 Tax=Acanthopleuribacter pedis TaxID=442870 RepID=A0A8J7QD59_9BACT|nr:hypothetical protein [Acanthopleuribacter pedis]MBO1321954.1 hypothetical protein [Acanthopleuribacter pedis]